MLGPAKPHHLDKPIAVSLEALVPANHFYRHLEAKLDLSFVRDRVSDLYAERGRPSIDPGIFFKRQLVKFFEGIRSERQLMQVVGDRLSLRWYRGYDLTEPLPITPAPPASGSATGWRSSVGSSRGRPDTGSPASACGVCARSIWRPW